MMPVTSQELFSVLDDASERTFLCAGTAESLKRYVFDGEAGKIGLEMKNLIACTSFLVEQKLVYSLLCLIIINILTQLYVTKTWSKMFLWHFLAGI